MITFLFIIDIIVKKGQKLAISYQIACLMSLIVKPRKPRLIHPLEDFAILVMFTI